MSKVRVLEGEAQLCCKEHALIIIPGHPYSEYVWLDDAIADLAGVELDEGGAVMVPHVRVTIEVLDD